MHLVCPFVSSHTTCCDVLCSVVMQSRYIIIARSPTPVPQMCRSPDGDRGSGTGAGVADAAGEPGGADGHRAEPGGNAADHGAGALAEVHDRPAVAASLALERAVGV